PAGLHREEPGEPDRGDSDVRSPVALEPAADDAAGTRPPGPEMPGEGPGRALAERPRPAGRAEVDRGGGAADGRADAPGESALAPIDAGGGGGAGDRDDRARLGDRKAHITGTGAQAGRPHATGHAVVRRTVPGPGDVAGWIDD